MKGFIVTLVLAILIFPAEKVYGSRVYGNAAFYYLHVSESNDLERRDDLTRETIYINYEDDLFVKNWIRLAANLDRQEFSYSTYHQFRPIYYFDLKSYGYALNISYSPYKRLSTTPSGLEQFYVYYKDWRGALHINYPEWPSLSLIYNQTSSFDREIPKRYDGRSRNFVAESIYQYRALSLRGNYNNLSQRSYMPGGKETVTRTYAGSAGVNKAVNRLGYLSSTYNYYQTDRLVDDIRSQRTRTHSLTAFMSSSEWMKFNSNAAYSGRFIEVLQQLAELDSKNQNFSAQAGYSPTGYLNFQLTKSYQISDESGYDQIVEYISYGAGLNRYFRNGVDTRINVSRTVFQQSTRQAAVVDSSGEITGTLNKGRYNLDNGYFSVSFKPYNYIKTYVDFSVSRNSDPLEADSRYQSNGSIDTRLNVSRKMEGRIGFTSLFQGERFSLGRSYSQNFNLGVSYYPQPNLNMNVTYIYSEYNVGMKSSNGVWNGYISYSFRRAFSAHFAVNSQRQKRQEIGQAAVTEEWTANPRTINAELVTYLSRQVTLTMGYLYSETEYRIEGKKINKSLQANLNIKL